MICIYFFSDEISRQLVDSDAKAIVTLTQLYPLVAEAVKKSGKPIQILTIKTQVSYVLSLSLYLSFHHSPNV